MALGSYGRSHQRQTLYYHLADTKIYIQGLDFESTIGNPTIAASIEAITINGLDFESTIGNINIRTNIQINGLDFLSTLGNLTVSETFSVAQIGHDADSFFRSRQAETNPRSIVRQFTYANSEFTDRITKYPSIKRNYVDVVGKGFTLEVENASKLMNELIEDRTSFKRDGAVFYGYQSEPSSANVLQIGNGFLTNVSYSDHTASLTFKNRLDLLSQTFVSQDVTSKMGISFTGSEWNPADMTFEILTNNSYGANFSNVTCKYNTQIHYDSWLQWKTNLAAENITVQGFFPYGTNYVQALKSIAELTDSAIYAEADNRIYFLRNLTGVESFSAVVSESDIIKVSTTGDAYDMCNKYSVPMSFSVVSNKVEGPRATVTFVNTASVNSFGTSLKEPTTQMIWYTNSANANNLAQRVVFRRRQPEIAVKITTPIKYLAHQLGDIIYLNLPEVGITAEPYTMIGQTINVEGQTMDMNLSVGHGIGIANLTVFEIGDDILGRLDNTTGVLG
jgi:hypothetical protein|tara:strand:- start:517 stop:2034 length:1518 start_codon:yes stop_codon:yes gene_type:complete